MRNLGKGFSFGLRSFHRLAILNRPERQLDVSSEPAGTDQPGLIPLLAGFPLTSCGPRRLFRLVFCGLLSCSPASNRQKHLALTSSPLLSLLNFRCRFRGLRLFSREAALQRVDQADDVLLRGDGSCFRGRQRCTLFLKQFYESSAIMV